MTDGGAILNNGLLKLRNVEFDNNNEDSTPKSFTNNGTIEIKTNSDVIIKE